jgi:hypothetical protein
MWEGYRDKLSARTPPQQGGESKDGIPARSNRLPASRASRDCDAGMVQHLTRRAMDARRVQPYAFRRLGLFSGGS